MIIIFCSIVDDNYESSVEDWRRVGLETGRPFRAF